MTFNAAGIFAAAAIGAALWAEPCAAAEISAAGLDRLPDADVVILGEIHDNPVQHENQARAVAALKPSALVFEMFGPEAALRASKVPRDDREALEEVLGWPGSGWPDFALYFPVFAAVPEAALFGGALPRETVRRAVGEGAEAIMGAGAGLYGLDKALPPDERVSREAAQDDAHCGALPKELLPGMVEAQRLRDAAIARAVVAAYLETGGPVAVITGNGHARKDWGVPAMLPQVLPDATVLSVGQFETPPEGDVPYDLWLVTVPPERDDPCASFQ